MTDPTRIEYGVRDGDDVFIVTQADRERAIFLAKRWTEFTGRQVIAVERTISTTEWRPTNTGIVPPNLADHGNG